MKGPVAWTLFISGIVSAVCGTTLGVVGTARGLDLPASRESMLALITISASMALLYAAVGIVIERREPSNAIAWIFLSGATALGVMTLAYGYADLAAYGDTGWPAAAWAGWLASWLLVPPAFLAPCFVAQLFPDGRSLPGAWRWILGGSALFATIAIVGVLLDPGPISPYPDLDNPTAPGGSLGTIVSGANDAVSFAVIVPFVASLAALVARFRRSRGIERAQMKWLAFSGAVLIVAFAGSAVWDPLVGNGLGSDLLFLTGIAALMFVPIAVAIGIIRYRLYEIDLVISRTLVYGSLTVILGAAYVSLVLAGQAAFSSFAGGSDLAIAVSTLVVAALFLPLRSRIQRVVDRRFYRQRYDAQRTLEAFGVRVREEVDLEELTADLSGVVTETMQPVRVSLWLRSEAPG